MVRLRKALPGDYEFAFRVKKAAMKEYIDKAYGWDETEQRRLHKERYNTEDFKIMRVSGVDVGITSVHREQEHIKINQIYLLPEYQDKGTGEKVMKSIIRAAAKANLPIRLQVLKVNPRAKSFYERLGFIMTGETDTHFLMEKCE